MGQGKYFRKKRVTLLLSGIACLAAMQLVRPSFTNPPVTADLPAPPEVKAVLQRACYNCHSNETQLAWFDKIAPASWLVAGHIRDGRKVLNFSHWDSLAPAAQKGKLFEILNQMTFHTMAPASYTLLHPDARVTSQELAALKSYLNTLVDNRPADTNRINTAGRQYDQWLRPQTAAPRTIQPAPNGIAYIPDYKNWTAISTSERFDNGTMRVILGNAIAVKAIQEQHVNPWPDGAIFAKVAWDQVKDSTGQIHTGEFKQVEFMIKDSKQYADTKGWGWARWWKGTQLIPYGKNKLFTTECMNCHQPMKDNDFVFTMPLQLKTR